MKNNHFFILNTLAFLIILSIPSISNAATSCYCHEIDTSGEGGGSYYKTTCPDASCKQGNCKYDKCAPDTTPITEIDSYEPKAAPAAKTETPKTESAPLTWIPNVGMGQFTQGTAVEVGAGKNILGEYINLWYTFLVGVAGLLAMVMIVFGGVNWLTSGGSSSAIGDAKKTISSALIGLTLALLSYVLLQIINPNLLSLKMPSMANITYSGDYAIPAINLEDEMSANSQTGGGSANLSTLKSDMSKTNQSVLNQVKKNNPDAKTPRVNSTARDSNDLHGLNRAVDYQKGDDATFDAYMNNLINEGTYTGYGQDKGEPFYYVKFPDGTKGRVGNGSGHWHIDNCQQGEVPIQGKGAC
ncbi:MAG: pilin [Patescibacteria group bacterium]|jgi:hypothetical protein